MRQGVKSPVLLLLAGLAWGSPARGQHVQDRGMLMGGGAAEPKAPVETDPWLPTGAPMAAEIPRPPANPACSFDGRVCVHPAPGVSPAVARKALAALENAYRKLVDVLQLPAPLTDGGLGGSNALDLYLNAEGSGALRSEHDAPEVTRFDSASAFCVLDGPALLERQATVCVGEAIAWRLDAGTTPAVRRGYAAHLWHIVGSPTALDDEELDDAQLHPELGLLRGALLFDLLDERRGQGHLAALGTALLGAAASKTAPNAWQWDNEPDVFDVLRHTLGDTPRKMAEVMGDLAVTRAFMDSRVRFDWSLPLSSLPRRVASQRAIYPTGSMYVWLGLDQPMQGETLAFQAEWEAPVTFYWTLVVVDAEGYELRRIAAPFKERATHVEQQLVNLEGAVGVIVVGMNLGGVDLAHPFDPDVTPAEPHECTVYLTKL